MCLFFIDSFMTVTAMCNTCGTLSTPASDVMNDCKQITAKGGKAMKIAKDN